MTRGDLPFGLDWFEERTIPEPMSGCTLWMGGRTTTGYGGIHLNRTGQHFLAHRVAWILEHGALARHVDLLHSCDNRLCVNPRHLRTGTQAENNRDTWARRRGKPGTGGPPKFNPETARVVLARLAAGETASALAREYCVHVTTVRRLKNGRSWVGRIERVA